MHMAAIPHRQHKSVTDFPGPAFQGHPLGLAGHLFQAHAVHGPELSPVQGSDHGAELMIPLPCPHTNPTAQNCRESILAEHIPCLSCRWGDDVLDGERPVRRAEAMARRVR